MFNLIRPSRLLCSALTLAALPACGSDVSGVAPIRPDPLDVAEESRRTYSQIVLASYEDSLATARDLDAAVQALVESPSEARLGDARQAWLDAREPYLQTEVYRFYEGPIDDPDTGPEGLINAWPLDENYIDYVEEDDRAGIVNDPTREIAGDALEALNEQGGEKNIATGYHAIEFLIWGQDQDDAGPGNRPYTDYVLGAGGTAANQDRRGEYLLTVSSLLVGHLEALVAAWEDGSANYRADFVSETPRESLRRILTGMIVLSGFETGGERLEAALLTHDQEDEHSCFSDNTHRDMIQDVQGVWNVWHGEYARVDGTVVESTGLDEAVHALDPTLAADLEAQIDESLARANALRPPFDQEIASGNTAGGARVRALSDALRAQEGLLEDVFRGFELEIPAPE